MGEAHDADWRWDRSLYAGSAPHYARGRVAYPPSLVEVIVAELGLNGLGRLLDLGCGPGSLTLPLAPYVEQALGVDADAAMLAEARRQAARVGADNVMWMHCRAEDVPLELGPFQVVALAQSFHWMDRRRVAGLAYQLLTQDGALVFVHATTHQGVEPTTALPYPRPPRAEIQAMITAFLGPRRRAGAGHRRDDPAPKGTRGLMEASFFGAAGFSGPLRREVPGRVVTRTTDQVIASMFSLSYAAPHLFGDRLPEFERQLRHLLSEASSHGNFSEQMREIALDIWTL